MYNFLRDLTGHFKMRYFHKDKECRLFKKTHGEIAGYFTACPLLLNPALRGDENGGAQGEEVVDLLLLGMEDPDAAEGSLGSDLLG